MADYHTFQCKKCYAQVQAVSTPGPDDCPKGGFHSWNKISRFIKRFINW